MILELLDDRVLVEPDREEYTTGAGIVLALGTDASAKKGRIAVRRGRVVACGPGRVTERGDRVAITVRPGDYVWYSVMLAVELRWSTGDESRPSVDLVLCEEGDLWGVEREGAWAFAPMARGAVAPVGTRILA